LGHVAVPELSGALVVGAGATRHVTASELPCARRWVSRDTQACALVLSFIFDLELVHGGTWSSGYRQWLLGPPRERLRTRGWGQHPSPCNLSELCTLEFRSSGAVRRIRSGPRFTWDVAMFGAPSGTVTRCSSPWAVTVQLKSRARGNHDHDPKPTGRRATEVVGVEAIVSAIPEPTERYTYGMCGAICFCAAVFLGLLLLSPVLTDARDLDPLVSV
jgi:hypothetical protein